MGLRIATNVDALKGQRNISAARLKQSTAIERLSSGYRINKSGDDAAGLAISEKISSDLRGLAQAKRNSNDGISLVQTAEGAISEVSNILVRLRELSVQSASDTLGDKERSYVDFEFQQLLEEVTRISEVTEFNGRKLLNGSGESVDIQVGIHNVDGVDRLSYSPQSYNVSAEKLDLDGRSARTKEESQENLDIIDQAMLNINENRSSLGALQNRLSATVRNISVAEENYSTAVSRIRDADFAIQTSELAKQSILLQAGISVLAQANQRQSSVLKLV